MFQRGLTPDLRWPLTQFLDVEYAMRRTDLWGWILFLLCAVVYTAVGVRNGDLLMTTGSVLFLAACLLFLVPYLRR